jgi:hypothetical protein
MNKSNNNIDKRVLRLLIILAIFTSCNNRKVDVNFNFKYTANNTDSLIGQYPLKVVQSHLERKYDNAVWLLYASNYHSDSIRCSCSNKDTILKNTNVVSLEPNLRGITIIGDTIELHLHFTPQKEKCSCRSLQRDDFFEFGFLRESDSVIYRVIDGCMIPDATQHGNMYVRNNINDIPLPKPIRGFYVAPDGSKRTRKEVFDNLQTSGFYPIDEQDSLFRVYVKVHRSQLAPTLLRLCKQRGVF